MEKTEEERETERMEEGGERERERERERADAVQRGNSRSEARWRTAAWE